jgi:hypothetical protein
MMAATMRGKTSDTTRRCLVDRKLDANLERGARKLWPPRSRSEVGKLLLATWCREDGTCSLFLITDPPFDIAAAFGAYSGPT